MAFFNHSTDIIVFPSAYRVHDGESKFTSEKNVTNMIKALAGKDSFVVGNVGKNASGVERFAFVVKGYYFELNENTVQSMTNLRVKITVNNGYLESSDSGGGTVLDVGTEFKGVLYDEADHSSDSDWLQILLNGLMVNVGYIKELIDPITGNWIDITKIFDVTYDGDVQHVTLKTDALSFINKTYIENLIAQYATALSDSNGNPITKGSTIRPVYFNNGLPIEMGPTGTNKNIGWDTSGDSGIKPIWFDGTDTTSKGFKPISGTQGTDTTPVYVSSGAIKPIKYSISTNVGDAGTSGAGKLAYYDNNGNIVPSSYSASSLGVSVASTTTPGALAYYDGTDSIKSIGGPVGGINKPIYLNNSGVPKQIDGPIGSKSTSLPYTYQSIYVSGSSSTANDGVLTAGQKVVVSTSARSGTSYSVGDIWFQI